MLSLINAHLLLHFLVPSRGTERAGTIDQWYMCIATRLYTYVSMAAARRRSRGATGSQGPCVLRYHREQTVSTHVVYAPPISRDRTRLARDVRSRDRGAYSRIRTCTCRYSTRTCTCTRRDVTSARCAPARCVDQTPSAQVVRSPTVSLHGNLSG
eukprot:COSAG02_NODE_2982_length_7621_cov_3.542808_2_plen_155_part_00